MDKDIQNETQTMPAVVVEVEASVPLATDISPDGRVVWDWAARFSDRGHTLDELVLLGKQVHNARNTCGSCKTWMTNACPQEWLDNRTGRKQGPSGMTIKCDRFAMSAVDVARVAKAEEKMAALKLRLQAAQRAHEPSAH